MSHGSSLLLSKLHLFLYPSQHLLPHYYDPHVYVFAHATLKIFDQTSLRHTLYSIRVRLAQQGLDVPAPGPQDRQCRIVSIAIPRDLVAVHSLLDLPASDGKVVVFRLYS